MPPLDQQHMSQASLSTFQVCPLRFKYRYIDSLFWSRQWGTAPDERAALERGQQFHLLARRYYEGVDTALHPDPGEPSEFGSWLANLQGFLPRTFGRDYYPEAALYLTRPDLRLQAKLDLLVVEPDGRATIYDWKTERRLPRREYRLGSMQTVVYRYLLCTAGGAFSPRGRFAPEHVAMVYWNPSFPHKWERLDYSQAQFEKDAVVLQELVARILRTPPDRFLATTEEKVCRSCEYNPICHGRRSERVELEEEEWLYEATLAWDNLLDSPD